MFNPIVLLFDVRPLSFSVFRLPYSVSLPLLELDATFIGLPTSSVYGRRRHELQTLISISRNATHTLSRKFPRIFRRESRADI